jgi:RNA-directed DNA polymerase
MSTALRPMDQWHTSRWPKRARKVLKRHKRSYRAAPRGAHRQGRRLQTLWRRAHPAKRLAVRQVTPDHRGQKTPGVAGLATLTPPARLAVAHHLPLNGEAAPGRRVYIPQPGTAEQRPWGIPTIADRAPQGVGKHALEPAWEAPGAPHSDGFRPGRRTWEARGALEGQRHQQPTGVLVADLATGFDRLDHAAW